MRVPGVGEGECAFCVRVCVRALSMHTQFFLSPSQLPTGHLTPREGMNDATRLCYHHFVV